MTNEWVEFRAYTEQPIYAAEGKKLSFVLIASTKYREEMVRTLRETSGSVPYLCLE